jgi:sugar O-acyltransferase (sialic acid O-acetyltransferase NeuD family)
MSKKRLVLFPFNGNAIEALDCINEDEYEVIGFIDDDPAKTAGHHKLVTRDILKDNNIFVLAVPGGPSSFHKREEVIQSLSLPGERYVTIIHPSASIGKNVKVGRNTLLMAGVVLTSNVVVGDHVCILPNTVIHHDSVIHDFSLIGSCVVIAGGTTIGKNCYIGSGSTIINGITVGDGSLVGIGSNVIHRVDKASKMVGNPAKNLNRL